MGNSQSRQLFHFVAQDAYINARQLEHRVGGPRVQGPLQMRTIIANFPVLQANEFARLAESAYYCWIDKHLHLFRCQPGPYGHCRYPQENLHMTHCAFFRGVPPDIAYYVRTIDGYGDYHRNGPRPLAFGDGSFDYHCSRGPLHDHVGFHGRCFQDPVHDPDVFNRRGISEPTFNDMHQVTCPSGDRSQGQAYGDAYYSRYSYNDDLVFNGPSATYQEYANSCANHSMVPPYLPQGPSYDAQYLAQGPLNGFNYGMIPSYHPHDPTYNSHFSIISPSSVENSGYAGAYMLDSVRPTVEGPFGGPDTREGVNCTYTATTLQGDEHFRDMLAEWTRRGTHRGEGVQSSEDIHNVERAQIGGDTLTSTAPLFGDQERPSRMEAISHTRILDTATTATTDSPDGEVCSAVIDYLDSDASSATIEGDPILRELQLNVEIDDKQVYGHL